jgi:hypothetical protein
VDDIVLANEVSETEPCLSLSNVTSSEVEECLTLSVYWDDPPMLAIIATVFIKRDLQIKFCLGFVSDKGILWVEVYRSVRKLVPKTPTSGTVQSVYPGDPGHQKEPQGHFAAKLTRNMFQWV